MRIVVTGGCGFIGSNLCDSLVNQGFEVKAIDDLSASTLSNIHHLLDKANFTFIKGDVLDQDLRERAFASADWVIHLAAKKIPRYGNTLATLQTNALGSFLVYEISKQVGARVISASTSDVYGVNPDTPFNESSRLVLGQPHVRRWAYAASKIFAEHALSAYVEDGLSQGISLRFFGGYGPRNCRDWRGGPIPTFIESAIRGAPLDIHGDGSQVRTFTYIDDYVSAIYACLNNPQDGYSTLNIGSQEEITILNLAHKIWSIINPALPINLRYVPYKTFGLYEDVTKRSSDNTLMLSKFSWQAQTPLDKGLIETLKWHKDLK